MLHRVFITRIVSHLTLIIIIKICKIINFETHAPWDTAGIIDYLLIRERCFSAEDVHIFVKRNKVKKNLY